MSISPYLDKRAWVQLASSQGPSVELDEFWGPFGEANMIFFFAISVFYVRKAAVKNPSQAQNHQFKPENNLVVPLNLNWRNIDLMRLIFQNLKFSKSSDVVRLPSDAAMLHTSSVTS